MGHFKMCFQLNQRCKKFAPHSLNPLPYLQASGEAAGDLFGRLRAVAQRKAAARSQRSDYFPVQLNTQGMMVGLGADIVSEGCGGMK